MISTEPMSTAGSLGTLLLSLIVIAFIVASVIQTPKLVVFGFLCVLFMFADSTYGDLNTEGSIYGRGVGLFYFSLLNLGLLVAGFAVLCKRLAMPGSPPL